MSNIIEMAPIITPSFMFRGITNNINTFPTENLKEGDIISDTSTDTIYVWIDNEGFVPLCGSNETTTEPENDYKELVECRCKACGAPLMISKYESSAKCEYCGTVYTYR